MTYIPSRTFHCRLPNSEKYIQLGKYYRVETEDVKRCRARIIELEMSGEYADEKYIFEKVNGFKFEITNNTKDVIITEINNDELEKRWDDLETKIENLIDESYENHKDDSVQIFSYVLELMKEINKECGLVD